MDTELILLNWRNGQTPAERLAAGLLRLEGYKDNDPQHPLGGPDGSKDILCTYEGKKALGAVYFATGAVLFSSVQKKFKADLEGAIERKVPFERFAFVANQHITIGEREVLNRLASSKGKTLDLFHIERIRDALDNPLGYGLRLEFLDKDISKAETISFFHSHHSQVTKLAALLDREHKRTETLEKELGAKRDTRLAQTLSTGIISETPDAHLKVSAIIDAIDGSEAISANIRPELVCFVHKAISDEGDWRGGIFRDVQVWIGSAGGGIEKANLIPADPMLIPELLIELCDEWNANFAEVSGLPQRQKLLAVAKFARAFLFIHPFVDGNGRVLRAFTRQQIFDLTGYDLALPFGADRHAYTDAFAAADKDSYEPIMNLMEDALQVLAAGTNQSV